MLDYKDIGIVRDNLIYSFPTSYKLAGMGIIFKPLKTIDKVDILITPFVTFGDLQGVIK